MAESVSTMVTANIIVIALIYGRGIVVNVIYIKWMFIYIYISLSVYSPLNIYKFPNLYLVFDACESSICQNGATCVNVADNFTCSCAAGWTGDLCETSKGF